MIARADQSGLRLVGGAACPPTPAPAKASAAVKRPAWITDELVELTLRTWQPRSRVRLTEADAVAMLSGVPRMLQILSGGTTKGAVR